MEELKKMPDFELAMSYALKENYELSKDYFSALIQKLTENEELNPAILLLVLKK